MHLGSYQGPWGNRRSRMHLQSQLKQLIGKPISPVSSRVVYVEIPPQMGRVSVGLLRRFFPNMGKVWRILLSRTGQECLLEFASHSSARRAVDARQQGIHGLPLPPVDGPAVKCAWVCPSATIPPLNIMKLRDLPIIEYIDDESVITPSSDWRRPRPTLHVPCSVSCRAIDCCGSSNHFLSSVLRMTGAFDDYPPDNNQVL